MNRDAATNAVAASLGAQLGSPVASQPAARVSGGCINECYRWESGSGPLFVKLGARDSLAVFEAEAAGLQELAQAGAVRVPRVLAVGNAGVRAYLALEWIEQSAMSTSSQRLLGEQLAGIHRQTAARFGWKRDNTIGSTPQVNTWTDDWATFFRDHRLRFQLELARSNGHGGTLQARGAELLEHVPALLGDHRPQPSLLHGDLWSGNAAADLHGRPVIFDPAVYYGDREADLAMTRLFGGFGSAFHEAYEHAWPLPPGADERVDLYNLYHVLNHLNLFGTSYLGQAQGLMDLLLRRIR